MFNKAADRLIVALVGFVVILVTQIWNGYVAEKTGSVILGPFLDSTNGTSFLITVENRTSAATGSIQFMLPKAVDVGSISTTAPLQIEPLSSVRSPSGFQSISVTGVQARSRVALRVPLDQETRKTFQIRVLNLDEVNFKLLRFEYIQTPWKRILLGAFSIALLSGVMFGGFSYYMNRMTLDLSSRAEENREALKDLQVTSSERIESLALRLSRYKALQGRVLSHYEKEVRFWRDTIRATLRTENQKASNDLLQEISRTLRTYATHGSAGDYEKVEVLLDELIEARGLREKNVGQPTTAGEPAPPTSGSAGR